jgi:hypothetical protein
MKISDIGSTRELSHAKRKKKVEAGESDFAAHLQEAAQTEAPGVVEAPTVSQVGAVLAAQEVPDSAEGRSRGLLCKYGDDVLDHLDVIRHGLLAGAVPKERLAALAKRMRQKRMQSSDARLNEIVDEIELRAEVEIAKLTRDV